MGEARPSGRVEVRRPLSVVFVDVVGSTPLSVVMDDEDYAQLIADYRAIAGGLINDHGGYVPKDEGDGRFIWFGWPLARRDDAQRAVAMGRSLIERLRPLSDDVERRTGRTLDVRIGIHTGSVLVTFPERTDKPEINDATVNFAAKVQQAAQPGTLLITEATAAALVDPFETVSRGTVSIDGLPGGIAVHEVVGPARARPAAGPFVGRSAELFELESSWQTVAGGESHAVVVTGAAGLGKSRLVAEVIRQTGIPDNVIVRIQAEAERSSVPFAAIGPAMASLGGESWRPVEDRATNLAEIVDRFEAAARQAELLVVVEDGQWLDASSEEALAAVHLRRIPGLMLLITARRPFSEPGLADVPELAIKPLGAEAARELVTQEGRSAGVSLDEGAVESLVDRAAGNPFFLRWLSRAANDDDYTGVRRLLRPRSGVPAVVQQAVRSQIDETGVDEDLTATASICGMEFSSNLLATILEREVADVEAAMVELRRFDIVVPDPTVDGLHRFSHNLVRDMAYDLLVDHRRREGHGRVADALVSLDSTDHAIIGHHLDKAGRRAEACRSLVTAARSYRRTSAYREATALLDRVVEIADDQGDDIDEAVTLEARELQATFAAAVDPQSYQAGTSRRAGLIDALGAEEEIRRRAMAKTRDWAGAMMQADLATGARMIYEIRREALRSFPEILWLNRGARGHFATYRGRYAVAERHIMASLAELAERGVDPWLEDNWATPDDPVALTHAFAPVAVYQRGRRSTAVDLLDRAWQRASTIPGGAHTMAHVGLNAAGFWELCDDGRQVVEVGEQISEIGQELELPFWELTGAIHTRRGQAMLDPGPDLCQQLDADGAVFDSFAALGSTQAHLRAAKAWLAIDHPDEARAALDRVRASSEATGVQYLDAEERRVRAQLPDDTGARVDLLGQAVAIARGQGAIRFALRALTDLVEVDPSEVIDRTSAVSLLSSAVAEVPEPDGDPDQERAEEVLAGAGDG